MTTGGFGTPKVNPGREPDVIMGRNALKGPGIGRDIPPGGDAGVAEGIPVIDAACSINA